MNINDNIAITIFFPFGEIYTYMSISNRFCLDSTNELYFFPTNESKFNPNPKNLSIFKTIQYNNTRKNSP